MSTRVRAARLVDNVEGPRTIGQFPVQPCQSGVWYHSKKFKQDGHGPQRFYRKRLPGWKAGTEIFISDFEW